MRLQGCAGAACAALLLAAMSLAAPAQAGPAPHAIDIEAMAFTPARLEVKAGDTVIWRNKDPFPHNATADNKGFRSPGIQSGRSWKFKARKKGVFPYACTLHPGMKAVLVVN